MCLCVQVIRSWIFSLCRRCKVQSLQRVHGWICVAMVTVTFLHLVWSSTTHNYYQTMLHNNLLLSIQLQILKETSLNDFRGLVEKVWNNQPLVTQNRITQQTLLVVVLKVNHSLQQLFKTLVDMLVPVRVVRSPTKVSPL